MRYLRQNRNKSSRFMYGGDLVENGLYKKSSLAVTMSDCVGDFLRCMHRRGRAGQQKRCPIKV